MQQSFHDMQDLPLILRPESASEKNIHFLVDYVKNNESLLKQLHQYGAILFRDFNLQSVEDFDSLVHAFSCPLKGYIGGDSPRKKVQNQIYTSTEYPAQFSISMHNELSFSPTYPDYLFFYCYQPASEQGETPIVDGRKLLRALDPNLIANFKSKKIKYVMNLHGGYGVGKSWQDCFETENRAKVEEHLTQRKQFFQWGPNDTLKVIHIADPIIRHPITHDSVFFSQADQWHWSNLDEKTYKMLLEFMPEEAFYHYCCHGDDTPLNIDELDAIRSETDALKVIFPWKKGDVMVLDNILTLHGRQPYKGERKIYVAMT